MKFEQMKPLQDDPIYMGLIEKEGELTETHSGQWLAFDGNSAITALSPEELFKEINKKKMTGVLYKQIGNSEVVDLSNVAELVTF